MTPILFPADATTYTTQGLGALSDAISCKVREERNGEFELEMQYPQTGLHFAEITDRCIILAIPSPWRAAQPFRIYRITKPIGGVCTIYARHITYDLSGIPVNVFSAQSAAAALSGLKANSATANHFEFWTDKQTSATFTVSVPASIRSLLGGSQGSVLDVYGGEYEWDGWTVKLHNQRGTDRGVTIRYGKNLTDIEQDRNIANVRTGLYPYWADNDGNLVVCDPPIVNAPGSYDFINIQTVDFSQEWQEAPTPEQLKARAEQYIQANSIGVPTVSISVSFVDLSRTNQYKDLALLEQCDLCDTVTVQFEALGIDATAEVVSIETDVLLERYDKIEVGSLRTNIADTIVDNQQSTNDQIKNTASYLEDRIQQSTDLITNGGGYIFRKFDANKNWVEIGSTDNLDLQKAINVWRWNNGGFGHSGTGYNGPFRTAITQDGHIVADFIDAGTLTANIMRAGVLQDVEGKAFYLDLPNGVLRMNATELSINSSAVATQDSLSGYTKTSEVRSRFAMDPTSVTISSGRITFNSNTLVINSSNFSLNSNGVVTIRSNGDKGYVQIYDSYIIFRNNSGNSLIEIFPESASVGVIRFFNGSGGFISDIKSSVQGGQGNIQLNVSGSGFFDVNRARISELTCPDSKIYSDKYMALDGETFAQMSGSYKEILPDNLFIGKGTFCPYNGKSSLYLDWVNMNGYWVLAGFNSPH